MAAFTVEEIKNHIAHYEAYRELPLEVMHELFASALAVTALTYPEAKAEIEAEAVAPAARKPRSKQA